MAYMLFNMDILNGFNHEQYIEIEKIKLQHRLYDLIEGFKDNVDGIKLLTIITKSNTESSKAILNSIEEPKPDILEINQNIQPEPNQNIQPEPNQNLQPDTISVNVRVKSRVNTRNRKIQQYNPNTFELIETFDGLMDAIRKIPEMSEFGLKTAALENKIYIGFRWFFISKSAEHIKYEIPPTVEVHHSSVPKLIAILNKDKTRIENVCESQVKTAEYIGIKRNTTINECLKTGKIFKNMYFSFFNDCEESLRNEYQSRRQLPICNVIKGTKIQQIDVISKNIIKTYESIADVLKHNCIARENVKRACVNNEVHNGYLWKYA